MNKETLFASMDAQAGVFEEMSDKIWEYAETGYAEFRSSSLQMDFLRRRGFRIANPVAGMPTAFIAEYGGGSPVIAILGEYDALPGMSQKADIPYQQPITEGGNGHGCGHHLLGTAGVEAACALCQAIDAGAISGTIRYYGCPAEETVGGKLFMIRAGLFQDVDIALYWHPTDNTSVTNCNLSVVMAKFRFEGVASHAASNPWDGRSALDAATLMTTGLQYLREHVHDGTRIAYAFLDAGVPQANIVHPTTELYCNLRTTDNSMTGDLLDRVTRIAQGAAMMTDTTVIGPTITCAFSNIIFNHVLGKLVLREMSRLNPCNFTKKEMAYAALFSPTGEGYQSSYHNVAGNLYIPFQTSTDFGDVSWVVPSIAFTAATYAKGTSLHSWGCVGQGKSSGAKRAMHMAAKILCGSAFELMQNPVLVTQAKAEFAKTMANKPYKSLLPDSARPGK